LASGVRANIISNDVFSINQYYKTKVKEPHPTKPIYNHPIFKTSSIPKTSNNLHLQDLKTIKKSQLLKKKYILYDMKINEYNSIL
jgi:hypothetical protein